MSTSEPPAAAGRYGTPDRWFVLALVSLNYFTLYLSRSLLSYIQPSLEADLALSSAQFGYLQQAFLFPYAVAQIGVGYLSDRFRRRSVLLTSLLLSAVSLAASGLAQGFAELFLWRVVLAIAQASSVPAIAGIVADCFTPLARSKAVGIYLLSSPASQVVAGRVGGGIADWNSVEISLEFLGLRTFDVPGWRLAYFVFAAFGVAVFVLLAVLLREPVRTERRGEGELGAEGASLLTTLGTVLRVRTYVALAAVYVLAMIAYNPLLFFAARYFYNTFGMSQGEAGLFISSWMQTGMVVGLLGGGRLADAWATRSIAGRSNVALIGLTLWIPSMVVLGTAASLPVVAAALLVMGLGAGLYLGNLWTTTFEVVDGAARSTAIGLLNVGSGLFASWSSPAVGALHDLGFGFGVIFAGLSLVVAASAAVMFVSSRFLLPGDYRGPLARPSEVD